MTLAHEFPLDLADDRACDFCGCPAVTEYMLQRGARGPSSLVGGSLSTGAAVTGVTPG